MHALCPQWSNVAKPVVGMLHLRPLPGAPRYEGDLDAVREALRRDADALAAGGVHGFVVENFGDAPFYPDRVPAHTVALMTELAGDVRRRFPQLPLGVNVLRNDGRSGLAIALAVGAAFIRVNVLCGARVTDQGVISGIAHELLRERAALGAGPVKIFADSSVKHSTPLGPERPLEDEVADTVARGGADAVVISGRGTGQPTDVDAVRRARSAARGAPVFVGSGVSAETIAACLPHADGFIVGTSLKTGGVSTNPIDPQRVRELMSRVR